MMTKKVVVSLSALLLFLAVPAWAQDDPVPKYDVFVGYSYLRGDVGQGHVDLAGGGVLSGAYHFNKYLSGVGEWSTHHDSKGGVDIDSNLFLFGPRFYFLRSRHFTPFAHALFGFHNTQVGFPGAGLQGDDDTGFAFAGGAGLDVNIVKHWAIRTQVDYVTMDVNLPVLAVNQNTDQFTDNIRVSGGIVFKWGE